MAKLQNSTLYNSINEKALTFRPKGSTNTVNTRLELTDDETATNEIDALGLESEQSAAGKMGMLMSMINAAYSQLLCKLTPYEVICHAEGIPTAFSVPNGALTIVPFMTLVYTPTDGSYHSPTGFQAGRSGYYDVDAMFQNYELTTPVTRVFMNIGTSASSTFVVDDVVMGTEQMRLQGSVKVWCEKDDYIRVYLLQNSGGAILFNTLAHPGASGYISISYAGSEKAATR